MTEESDGCLLLSGYLREGGRRTTAITTLYGYQSVLFENIDEVGELVKRGRRSLARRPQSDVVHQVRRFPLQEGNDAG